MVGRGVVNDFYELFADLFVGVKDLIEIIVMFLRHLFIYSE